ncbi:MAG: hypothetical protein U0470_14395 [Anaerolineae bacterium]
MLKLGHGLRDPGGSRRRAHRRHHRRRRRGALVAAIDPGHLLAGEGAGWRGAGASAGVRGLRRLVLARYEAAVFGGTRRVRRASTRSWTRLSGGRSTWREAADAVRGWGNRP